jgi:hypothetical protein
MYYGTGPFHFLHKHGGPHRVGCLQLGGNRFYQRLFQSGFPHLWLTGRVCSPSCIHRLQVNSTAPKLEPADGHLSGWSEPAATNAPVADEPVEAVFRMNENPILPACIYFFFPPLLYPKIFPPTTYQPLLPPLTPSPELQRHRTRASLEQGSLKGSLEQRAWSKGAGPTRELEWDPGKHLTFFSLVYFVCLFVELLCSAT